MKRTFFRKSRTPGVESYIAVFPEITTGAGKVVCASIYKKLNGEWVAGSLMQKRIDDLFGYEPVRKEDQITETLINAISRQVWYNE